MPDFKVQRGVATIPASATTVVITAGVDYVAPASATAAFFRIVSSGSEGTTPDAAYHPNLDEWFTTIANPSNLLTSVTFQRTTATTSTVEVSWELVEYIGPAAGANEIKVRAASQVAFGATNNSVSTAVAGVVNDAKVVVFLTGQRPLASSNIAADIFSTTSWNNSPTSTATVTRDRSTSSFDATASYAVVEFTGSNWSIQRISHTFATAGAIETSGITAITSVAQAFLHVQATTNESSSPSIGHEAWLSATNQVSFFLPSTAPLPATKTCVAWVVANSQTGTGAAIADRYNGSTTTLGTTNIAITTVTSLANTSVWGLCAATVDSVASSGLLAAGRLTALNNLAIVQPSPFARTLTYRAEIFQWPVASGTGSGQVATKLAINRQPSGAVSAAVFTTQPIIQISDASNGQVLGSTAAVTAAIASGTGVLSGTLTVNAVNGIATFADLKITGAGTDTIIFTSTGLTSVTSASVVVAAAGTQGSGTVTGTPKDNLGNALAGRGVVYSSSNPNIATVDSATGNVMAVHAGTCTIKATSEGVDSNLCTVTVS